MQRIPLAQTGLVALLLAILALLLMVDVVANAGSDVAGGILAWTSATLAAAGLWMFLRVPVEWWFRSSEVVENPRILPGAVLRYIQPLRRHRQVHLMLELPNFGLYWGWILNILMFVFMIFQTPTRPPSGLVIRNSSPSRLTLRDKPNSETVGVYIGAGEHFYVNGRIVSREELRASLRKALGRTVFWTVYVEADDNSEFGDTVYAVDTIQGLGANVIWITPKVRQELGKDARR
jgi:biopolymer transport protein ExbD